MEVAVCPQWGATAGRIRAPASQSRRAGFALGRKLVVLYWVLVIADARLPPACNCASGYLLLCHLWLVVAKASQNSMPVDAGDRKAGGGRFVAAAGA